MAQKIIGIDYGSKRVGVALSDDDCQMAFPQAVLQNDKKLFANLREVIEAYKVTEVVVGESKDFNMQPNKIMGDIHTFCDRLKKDFGLPVHLEPEFLSSHQAERFQGKNEMLDASAAAIILQSYIDKQ